MVGAMIGDFNVDDKEIEQEEYKMPPPWLSQTTIIINKEKEINKEIENIKQKIKTNTKVEGEVWLERQTYGIQVCGYTYLEAKRKQQEEEQAIQKLAIFAIVGMIEFVIVLLLSIKFLPFLAFVY